MAKKRPKGKKSRRSKTSPSDDWNGPAKLRGLLVAVRSVTPDPKPIKDHGEEDITAIAESFALFGQDQPILLDADNVVIGGNGRLMAAERLGWTRIAAVKTGLRGEMARLRAIVDNRTPQLSGWNTANLSEIADRDLPKLSEDVDLDSLGLGEEDLSSILGVEMEDLEAGERDDVAPKKPKKAITKTGDVWKLGRHRILCGDATVTKDAKRLVGKVRPDVMFTDPPYGVMHGAPRKNAISGDLSQAEIPLSFTVAVEEILSQDARIYVCGGSSNIVMMAKLFDHYLQLQPRIIVWVKESFVLRPYNYHSQFEFVYFGWKGRGGGKFWYGDRKQSDIWQVHRDRGKDYLHPTQKPVELSSIAIRNSCPEGGTVYDPFLGSGSTLIACEKLGRSCYGMEIDPGFVDVVVHRWQSFTGKEARRIKR